MRRKLEPNPSCLNLGSGCWYSTLLRVSEVKNNSRMYQRKCWQNVYAQYQRRRLLCTSRSSLIRYSLLSSRGLSVLFISEYIQVESDSLDRLVRLKSLVLITNRQGSPRTSRLLQWMWISSKPSSIASHTCNTRHLVVKRELRASTFLLTTSFVDWFSFIDILSISDAQELSV